MISDNQEKKFELIGEAEIFKLRIFGHRYEEKKPLLCFILYFIFCVSIFCFCAVLNTDIVLNYSLKDSIATQLIEANYNSASPQEAKKFLNISNFEDVYSWIKNVVIPLAFHENVSNFNEIFKWSIYARKGTLKNNFSENFKLYQPNILSANGKSILEEYEAGKDETINLDKLKNDGWFSSLTTYAEVDIHMYNGVSHTICYIKFFFELDYSGRVKKSLQFVANTARKFYLNLILPLIFLSIAIFCCVIEYFALKQAKRIGFSKLKAFRKYLYWRIDIMFCCILKICVALIWIAEWFLVFFTKIPDGLMETYFAFTVAKAIIICICFVFIIWRSFLYLQHLNSIFKLPVYLIHNFFGNFIGVFLTFIILWIGWSCANHILLGLKINDFADFYSSLFYTFLMIFGVGYIASFSLYSMTIYFLFMFIIWFIIIPFFAVLAVFSYQSYAKYYDEKNTEKWLIDGIFKIMQNYIFCCTDDLDEDRNSIAKMYQAKKVKKEMKEKAKEKLEMLEKRGIITSTYKDRKLESQRVSLIFFTIFIILFCVNLYLIFDVSFRYRLSNVKSSEIHRAFFVPSRMSVMPNLPTLAKVKSECNPKGILPQHSAATGSTESSPLRMGGLGATITLENINTFNEIYEWMKQILIGHILNADYMKDRHSILLTNPPVITILTRAKIKCNNHSLGKAFYPTIRVCKPSYNKGLSDSETFNSVKINLEKEYVKGIYFMDTIQQMQEFFDKNFVDNNYLDYQMYKFTILWSEFNGDLDVFVINKVEFKLDCSGKMENTVSTTNIMGWSVDPDLKYSNISFIMNTITAIFLGIYIILAAYFVTKKVYSASYFVVLDMLILFSFLSFLFFFSENINSFFYPGWLNNEIPEKLSYPDVFIGPLSHRVYVPGSSIGDFISASYPSLARALRIVKEMDKSYKEFYYIRLTACLCTIFVIIRLLFYGETLPNIVFPKITHVVYSIKWQLIFITIFFFVFFIGFWFVGYIALGSQHSTFSSPNSSFLSCLLLLFSAWNMSTFFSETNLSLRLSNEVDLCIYVYCFVMVMVFFWKYVIFAILHEGSRRSKLMDFELINKKLEESCGMKSRKKIVLITNDHIILYWKSFLKAIQLKNNSNNEDYLFANVKDTFFSRFQEMDIFNTNLKSVNDEIKKSILATNLIRLQQNITDIYFLKAKLYNMNEEIASIDNFIKNINQVSKAKLNYIEKMEDKIEEMNLDIEKLEDKIALINIDESSFVDHKIFNCIEPNTNNIETNYKTARELEEEKNEKLDERQLRIKKKREQMEKLDYTPVNRNNKIVAKNMFDTSKNPYVPNKSEFNSISLAKSQNMKNNYRYGLVFCDSKEIHDDENNDHKDSFTDDEESWEKIRQRFTDEKRASFILQNKGDMLVAHSPVKIKKSDLPPAYIRPKKIKKLKIAENIKNYGDKEANEEVSKNKQGTECNNRQDTNEELEEDQEERKLTNLPKIFLRRASTIWGLRKVKK